MYMMLKKYHIINVFDNSLKEKLKTKKELF